MASVAVGLLFAALSINRSYAVDSLRFLIIGDMGGVDYYPYTTYYERCTAEEMGKIGDQYAPQYVLELGDNFYFDGVTDVNDFRFKVTYEDVYTAPSLQVPWYLIAGNHDHNGNVSAEILYSNYSKRWNFPDYYYYKEFPVGSSSNKILGIVFIDTIQLCGNSDDDRLALQPSGPKNKLSADDQWDFIDKTLQTSKADYLFVAGHYPVYSVAEHGPTQCLIDSLQPMLEKYNVNGYLCGHEHNLQHLQVTSSKGNVLNYFVNGMANFVDPSMEHQGDVPEGSLKFHNADLFSKGGFMYTEATDQNMTCTFIDANGKRLYTSVLLPRQV